MYESHDMRHTGFPQVDCGQRDPRVLGSHSMNLLSCKLRIIGVFRFLGNKNFMMHLIVI